MEGELKVKDCPRILVLTLSFGSGHVRAAQAVAAELRRLAPRAEILVIDALEHSRTAFRALYVRPYWAMVRYAPVLWKRFFEARVKGRHEQTAPAWAFRRGCPEVFTAIARFKPEAIVACEVAACEMAVIAKRARLTEARVVNVITDHEAEPVWVKEEICSYAVATERVRDQLCGWGAGAEKIMVTGIPTAQEFHIETDKRSERARFGIKDERPLVLLMGGGQGPTRMDEIVARLCQCETAMHLVAIAGRDERVRKRLARISSNDEVNLHVFGWTESIAPLMRAAFLLATKPGGLTLTEASQCALPVVMFDGIPGPELLNAEHFVSNGAGIMTRNVNETVAAIEKSLRNEEWRNVMSLRSKRLSRPGAATEIARLVLDGNNEDAAIREQRLSA
jgi:processive 1,2-diacylglycerol beta-glucosyltransferase